MAAQYNPNATDPLDTVVLEAYNNAVVLQPFEDGLCGVECKPKFRQADTLLCRNDVALSVSGPQDVLYDLCDFYIATAGCPGSSVVLGDLWISYDIEFINPYLPADVQTAQNTAWGTSSSGVNAQNPFGTTWNTPTALIYNAPKYNVDNFVKLINNAALQFTPQPQTARYLVTIYFSGPSYTAPTFQTSVGGGAVVTTARTAGNPGSATQTESVCNYLISFGPITGTQVVVFSASASVPMTSSRYSIVAVPPTFAL